jgi:hypothetical protein
MTTTALDLPRTTVRPRGWARFLPPLGGLGLVAGMIGLIVSPAGDDSGETPTEILAYAASHESWTLAILLFALASIALSGAFVAGLHARLVGIATPTESALVLIGGTVFALCFALCWIIWGAPLDDMPVDAARARAQAEAYLGYDDIGWFLLAAAGMGAALMAIPASLAAMRAGVPRLLGWLGVAAGVGSLATVAFFGLFAWMAWIAGASIVLLVAAARE